MKRTRTTAQDKDVRDIDWQMRYGEVEQPEVAKFLGYTEKDKAETDKAGRKRKSRNPVESAAALSEAFHGRPAEKVTEYEETVHEHSVLTGLGRLLSVELKGGTKIEFGPDTQLASNEAGTQLYAVGGDQEIDLDGFDVDPEKESVCLGQVKRIDYKTAKFHLGKTDKTPGPYTHKLGEESGKLPLLCYDTVNRLVSFVGGSYRIDLDMDGKYSAGIRD
jgi:hypothetical protein